MSALGRDKEELLYAPCGFALDGHWPNGYVHFLKRNWLKNMVVKNEKKKLTGKILKKTRSLEIYVYLPYDIIVEVCNFYLSSCPSTKL